MRPGTLWKLAAQLLRNGNRARMSSRCSSARDGDLRRAQEGGTSSPFTKQNFAPPPRTHVTATRKLYRRRNRRIFRPIALHPCGSTAPPSPQTATRLHDQKDDPLRSAFVGEEEAGVRRGDPNQRESREI
jgi:hypothetical protein